MKLQKIIDWATLNEEERKSCLERPTVSKSKDVEVACKKIVDDVRARGDEALFSYTRSLDNVDLKSVKLNIRDIQDSLDFVDDEFKEAVNVAKTNIEKFHRLQKPQLIDVETSEGILCYRKYLALDTVGLYIPGGSAPLISTVLMLAIPAQIAGCRNMVLCTPPGQEGSINPELLYAARVCGIDQVFTIGGAQAIAAMAYGTESVPKVEKIFGPGNAYVTTAKSIVSNQADGPSIDMPAGPSEVMVIVDENSDPEFAALDLLSQAEHGADSQAVLISTCKNKISDVLQFIRNYASQLERRDIVEASLQNAVFIYSSDREARSEIINSYAPEHLIISTEDYANISEEVRCAGSVFLGPWTPESLGDYASGTNHVLPTGGFARKHSGLGVESFMRSITFQKATESGLKSLAPTVIKLAEKEGLGAHELAVKVRSERNSGGPELF